MKCAITRKNRDKRGGHSGTNLGIVPNGSVDFTPIERALLKQISKKKMRRQYKMTHKAIERELANDFTWSDYERELELDEMWYDDEPMMLDSACEDEHGIEWYEEQGYSTEDWFGYDPYPMADWEMEEDRFL